MDAAVYFVPVEVGEGLVSGEVMSGVAVDSAVGSVVFGNVSGLGFLLAGLAAEPRSGGDERIQVHGSGDVCRLAGLVEPSRRGELMELLGSDPSAGFFLEPLDPEGFDGSISTDEALGDLHRILTENNCAELNAVWIIDPY